MIVNRIQTTASSFMAHHPSVVASSRASFKGRIQPRSCLPAGVGGKKGSVEKCPVCKGRGMQIHIQQIGPGMVQQIQTMCIECKGQGERINPKDRCESCNGAKVIREKKIIEVHVEKGEAVQHEHPRLAEVPLRC